ncbi:MAG TPA: serine/threonine-protein kinase [Planctomycetaceae bacterium]|nr:serine/threonine-protein kinase [Planctomycetaceae bacterium]
MKFLKGLFKHQPRLPRIDITKRFDLIGRVGQGSMSKVWRARDTKTGRTVALKVLDKEKTRRLEQRFVGLHKPTEGEIAIQLQHPHIVRTFEHGLTRDREQFLVMEFVEGVGLSYLVDVQNELMRTSRLRFLIELGEAIHYFHQKNFIHRDICPRNVLIDGEHHVKLIDFGLVVPNTPEFRKPGNRTGTANYMAPELIKRLPTDQRIDIFSFSVTAYEMFTRKLPWDASETFDAAVQHINTPPDDIREHAPDIDREVAEILMRGLQRQPADRWQTMRELVEALREVRLRLEPKSRPQEDEADSE